jgi:hypothetical protein
MRRMFGPASAVFLALGSLAIAVPARAASPTPSPARVKAHGVALTGRVTRIEPKGMTLSVRDAAGKETVLVWTAATRIAGGALKAGDAVTLRYLDKDRKHIATYIRINAPVTAGPSLVPVIQTPTPIARGL